MRGKLSLPYCPAPGINFIDTMHSHTGLQVSLTPMLYSNLTFFKECSLTGGADHECQ